MKRISKKALVSFITLSGLFALAVSPTFAQFGFEYGTQLNLGTRDLRATIMQVINVLMGFLGIVALVIVLAGGFKYMTAMGSDEKIGEAKKLMAAGVVGLLIILASYGIAFFVLTSLISATGGSPN